MREFNLKYFQEQLGPFVTALMIGIFVFILPKLILDGYKFFSAAILSP